MRLKGGFTIIEIMLVLSIVGVLLLVGASGVKYALTYSHDQNNKEILAEMQQSLQKYYSEYHAYPYAACPYTSVPVSVDKTWSPNAVLSQFQLAISSNPGDYESSYSNDPAYILYNQALSKINSNDLTSFGYCSGTQSSADGVSQADGYILVLKTTSSEVCKDLSGNNLYMIGNGTYVNAGSNRIYYNIPEDYLGFATGIQCYNSSS